MSYTTHERHEETLGGLVHELSDQIPQLVRSEIRLAQAEMTEKGRRAGRGAAVFSAAGLMAFFGLAAALTAAIVALDLVLPLWAAALIVAGALFLGSGIAAVVGRSDVRKATPATPERAVRGVRDDVSAMKGDHR
jgi:hypothetical protein